MTLKDALAKFLGRPECEKLIRYDGRMLDLGALGAELGGAKFSLASFKTAVEKLREASEAALAMDDYQYNVCKIAAQYDKGSPERIQYNKWRIAALGYFTSLRMTLAAMQSNPTEELRTELEAVIRDMHDFVRAIAKTAAPSRQRTYQGNWERPKEVVTGRLDEATVRNHSKGERAPVASKPAPPAVSGPGPLERAFLHAGLTEEDVNDIAARV